MPYLGNDNLVRIILPPENFNFQDFISNRFYNFQQFPTLLISFIKLLVIFTKSISSLAWEYCLPYPLLPPTASARVSKLSLNWLRNPWVISFFPFPKTPFKCQWMMTKTKVDTILQTGFPKVSRLSPCCLDPQYIYCFQGKMPPLSHSWCTGLNLIDRCNYLFFVSPSKFWCQQSLLSETPALSHLLNCAHLKINKVLYLK